MRKYRVKRQGRLSQDPVFAAFYASVNVPMRPGSPVNFIISVTFVLLSSSHLYKPTPMRKVNLYKWLFVAALLSVSLSALSLIAYQPRINCPAGKECCQRTMPEKQGEMLWDAISRQFISVFTIQ